MPEEYFQHLPDPWPLIARRIYLKLQEDPDPVGALRAAFDWMGDYERRTVKDALLQIAPVAQIPGLSYRQREALITLRSVKSASLSQICAILSQDRRNTYRRLNALAAKGLALKFYQPNGVYFFAVSSPLDRPTKRAINEFLDEVIRSYSQVDGASTPPTQSTQATSST